MKLKDKIKSYSFWVSLASAIILILKILGNRFGFVVDETMVSDLFTALCSILVLLGIIVPPQSASNNNLATTKNQELISTGFEGTNNQNTINTNESLIEKPTQTELKIIDVLKPESNIEPITNQQDTNESTIQEQTTDNQNTIIENESVVELIDNQVSEDSKEEKADFKQMFYNIKEKFSDNLDLYIFELQEEIRKTREGM
jgi:uncharacterized membrane protein